MNVRPLLRYGLLALIGGAAVAASQATMPAPDPPPPPATMTVTAAAGTTPEEPRETVDVATLPVTTRRIHLLEGGDLQRALDEARPGDEIALASGATFHGPFRLTPKEGDGWIVVTSASPDALPGPGERVGPSDAPGMARIRAASGSPITAAAGAHHYRFVGLDISPDEGRRLTTLVQLGGDEDDARRVPHHIIFDRCYLHGDPTVGTRRGIAMNSRYSAVINSYLSDFKDVGADSQAIAGWNGAGPFTISNNYLEAAGENVMFGGADPSIRDLVPSDIAITRNYLAKPLRWRRDRPDSGGTAWSVKNLLELKNARRVVIDGNLFEHNWPADQNGFAILLTVRNQSGGAPWSVVEDVVFANNVVRHVGAGINILGRDDNQSSRQTSRIAVRGNLFTDVGGQWGSGRLFQLLDGTRDVSITHNTAFQTGTAVFGGDHAPHTGFVFTDNVVLHNTYGITGSGTGSGRPTLDRYFPASVVRGNVLIGGSPAIYPTGNFFPATPADAGYPASGDGSYGPARLQRYAGAASDGLDIGADIGSLTTAMAVVLHGRDRRAADTAPWLGHGLVQAAGFGGGHLDGRPAVLLFWVSLLLLAYAYAGYPLIAWLRSQLRPRLHVLAPVEPTVSIVLVVHNEADRIEARIENLLALDYPVGRRQILIGSDGSSDDTVLLARRYAEAGVRVEVFPEWHGKPAVLNALVRAATGDIVLFADARQRFEPDVLRILVSHFADPTLGAVSGELMLEAGGPSTSMARGTSFYWRYEKFIRLHESRAASTVGATGAIYAIRRDLFEEIPDDTILDDVLIPLRIVRRGYAVQFEPAARAHDAVSATAGQECARKLRTIAGTFQLFAREPWLLSPLHNPLWFETVSHKALRLALPLLHATLLAANLALAGERPYGALLVAHLGFYAAALTGHALRHARRRPIAVAVPYAMCLLLWATVGGFARFMTHRQAVTWEHSAPPVSPPSSSRTMTADAGVTGVTAR